MALGPRSRRVSERAALGTVVALFLASGRALADGDASDARAEALFREAKRLMAQGNDASACPKLAESQHLDPGTGTLLMLALCHERTGRTASAWATYHEALARAQQEQRADREEFAFRHLAALEPRLVRVRLRVAEANATLPGFEVRRDGETVAAQTWQAPLPLDPGTHLFEAYAQAKRLFSYTMVVGSEPAHHEIAIPALSLPAPPAPATATATALSPRRSPPVEAPRRSSTSGLRIAAYGAGFVTLAAVAVGSYFGVRAIGESNDAQRLCPAYPCAPGANEANRAAHTSAVLSNIAFATAGAAALTTLGFFVFDAGQAPNMGPTPASTARSRSLGVALEWKGQW